ncbi:MAG: nucleotidyltransferase domain-containing protein [Bermanella sp.]
MSNSVVNAGLTEIQLNKILSVFSQYDSLDMVKLYGSRAKGNYRPGSDVDLAMFGDNFSHKDLTSLALQLDDLMLAYTFDLSRFQDIESDELVEHINRIGITIYESI